MNHAKLSRISPFEAVPKPLLLHQGQSHLVFASPIQKTGRQSSPQYVEAANILARHGNDFHASIGFFQKERKGGRRALVIRAVRHREKVDGVDGKVGGKSLFRFAQRRENAMRQRPVNVARQQMGRVARMKDAKEQLIVELSGRSLAALFFRQQKSGRQIDDRLAKRKSSLGCFAHEDLNGLPGARPGSGGVGREESPCCVILSRNGSERENKKEGCATCCFFNGFEFFT